MKLELKRREEELAKSSNSVSPSGGVSSSGGPGNHVNHGAGAGDQQGFISSTLTNLVVIVGFAAFAYTVKYVLRSIVE